MGFSSVSKKAKKALNLIEAMAEEDECFYDQPCQYGYRVECHAVYCHNNNWKEAPTKCRRTWYTGGQTKDEDCPGFSANPGLKDDI